MDVRPCSISTKTEEPRNRNVLIILLEFPAWALHGGPFGRGWVVGSAGSVALRATMAARREAGVARERRADARWPGGRRLIPCRIIGQKKGLALGQPLGFGRGERIRTSGPYVPNVVLYQAELHPVKLSLASRFARRRTLPCSPARYAEPTREARRWPRRPAAHVGVRAK